MNCRNVLRYLLPSRAGRGSLRKQSTEQLQAHLANSASITWCQQELRKFGPTQLKKRAYVKSMIEEHGVRVSSYWKEKWKYPVRAGPSQAWAHGAFRQGELSSCCQANTILFKLISLFIDCGAWHWNTVPTVYLGRLTWIHRGLFSCYLH